MGSKKYKEENKSERTTFMQIFSDGVPDTFDPQHLNSEELPLFISKDMVLFPGNNIPIPVRSDFPEAVLRMARKCERTHDYVGVILQKKPELEEGLKQKDLYQVGTIAEVMKILDMPDGTRAILLQGRRVFKLESLVETEPYAKARVSLVEENNGALGDKKIEAIVSNLKDAIARILTFVEDFPREISFALSNMSDPQAVINFLSSSFPMKLSHRQSLLEHHDLFDRAISLATIINTELQFMEMKSDIARQTQAHISDAQREAFLHTQLQAIQQQLGETSGDDIFSLKEMAAKKKWGEEVKLAFQKELGKLSRMNEQSPDYSVQYNYLRTMVDLPWGKITTDNLNLQNAGRVLDRDHYGLEKVKERILEHLAVLKMRGDMKSPILCLYGPPGVGKTSLGKSVAAALKREYVRISLGGLHDEAEIRGHRRTYIGAMPGRIINGLLKCKSDNPVFVLDEIDKISSDFKGDPSSALLEVLDPEQNKTFHDNYLDLDYDLSQVFFIATANSLSSIAAPLLDRMEVIDLSGYIMEEKVEIGMRHLLPKQKQEHGLSKQRFSIPRKTMEAIIERYTRESGVRMLDKCLAKVMRKAAWKIASGENCPTQLKVDDLHEFLGLAGYDKDKYEGNDYAGVVTGLAWTAVGGTILLVESSLSKGNGEKVTLTGSLGDVMKESAMLALQYIKSHAEDLDIPEKVFENYNVHIHFPEGATPKDGPSAGITMVTSLVSLFKQCKVRPRLAMTGEITLRGRVLPVGGIKEKILAAKRAGITDIVLCIDNQKDIEDIKPIYLEGVTFHYVRNIADVLEFALLDEKVEHARTLI